MASSCCIQTLEDFFVDSVLLTEHFLNAKIKWQAKPWLEHQEDGIEKKCDLLIRTSFP
jgi:hypothetical protein